MAAWQTLALIAAFVLILCGLAAGRGTADAPDRADAFVIQFGASWCPACQAMHRDLRGLRREGYPLRYYDVDNEDFGRIHARFGFRSVPAIAIVGQDLAGKGFLIAKHEGRISAQELRTLCRRHGILPRPPQR